jgi:hypothetical protein
METGPFSQETATSVDQQETWRTVGLEEAAF